VPTTRHGPVEIHYERSGAGARLVFCNGSGATLDSVRPLLELLAGRFDLLAYDQRGIGLSTCPHEPYTMADLAVDLDHLLDAVGWDTCLLSGLSFGGMVAQEYAVTFPDRVERLALLSTSPGGAFPSYPLEQLADLPPAERASASLLLSDRRWTPEWLASHPADQALVRTFAAGQPAHENDDQRWGRLAQLDARQRHDVLDRLGRITAPTFVGNGAFDDIAPVANGEAIAERVPDATLHVYQGGHIFLFQDPSAWTDVTAFLTGGS
jgi:3-oxoadipate enol-lactonase